MESSAVLSWLLGELRAGLVQEAFRGSDVVIASELTLVECDRVLIRAAALGNLRETDVAERRARLDLAAEHWTLLPIGADVVERARRPFPSEPVRTLDAIHLATAIVARSLVPGLGLLSLDETIRECGRKLGFDVLPE